MWFKWIRLIYTTASTWICLNFVILRFHWLIVFFSWLLAKFKYSSTVKIFWKVEVRYVREGFCQIHSRCKFCVDLAGVPRRFLFKMFSTGITSVEMLSFCISGKFCDLVLFANDLFLAKFNASVTLI